MVLFKQHSICAILSICLFHMCWGEDGLLLKIGDESSLWRNTVIENLPTRDTPVSLTGYLILPAQFQSLRLKSKTTWGSERLKIFIDGVELPFERNGQSRIATLPSKHYPRRVSILIGKSIAATPNWKWGPLEWSMDEADWTAVPVENLEVRGNADGDPPAAAENALAKRLPPPSIVLSPDELNAQNEFKKMYNNSSSGVRQSSLDLLAKAYHRSSWQMLASVAASDSDEYVRVHAISVLAHEPARNGAAAHELAQCFSALKSTDVELKIRFAKEMSDSEFKYEIANALQDTLVRMRYPESYTINSNGISNLEIMRKLRVQFRSLLESFNKTAKCNIEANGTAPARVQRWWESN